MEYLVYFLLSFILVYLFYFFTVVIQKKRYEKFSSSNQVMYFKNRFKIKNIDIKRFINEISLINSFIIALTFTLVMVFESLILQVLVGMFVVIIMMLLGYSLYGKILKRRENNV